MKSAEMIRYINGNVQHDLCKLLGILIEINGILCYNI